MGNSIGIAANAQYVRLRPSNEAELETLMRNPGLILFDYPLNREVVQEGDYYPQPGVGDNEMPWLYTVVDINAGASPLSYLPSTVQQQVLQDVFITDNLDLENEALRITGNPYTEGCTGGSSSMQANSIDDPTEGCDDPWGCGSTGGGVNPPGDKNPAGYILHRDKELGDLGVPNVKVVARRWFKVETQQTNDLGYFRFNKTFRNKVNILVHMTNSQVNVRGIKGLRFWQVWEAIHTSIGKYSGVLNNIHYVFADDEQAKTNAHKLWFASTVMSAQSDYVKTAATQHTGALPSDLTILLTTIGKKHGYGSTPMNRHRTNAGTPSIDYVEYFIAQPGDALLSQFHNYLFNSALLAGIDIDYDYNKAGMSSSEARRLIYHEMTHAAHFNLVGQVWWNTFVYAEASEITRWGQNDIHSPYGDGAGINASYIALGESWAEHMGRFMAETTYGSNCYTTILQSANYYKDAPVMGLNAMFNSLEDYNPKKSDDVFHWIPYGLYYDMIDTRAESSPIPDYVSGYTNQDFYGALSSSVTSIPQFRDKLLLNRNNWQVTQVIPLFYQYGY